MLDNIKSYNSAFDEHEFITADTLANIIDRELIGATSKIWHNHPVWFLNDNPIVGYSKQKKGIRLMFWSGADFEEEKLNVRGAKFKDASIFYRDVNEVVTDEVSRWLEKSRKIQWDYKNIVKRKGRLERLI